MKTREIDGVKHFLVPLMHPVVGNKIPCGYCALSAANNNGTSRCDNSCADPQGGFEWVNETSFVALTLLQGD